MRQLSLSILIIIFFSCEEEESNQPPGSLFITHENPVFESPLDLAADPAILRDGDTLYMYYSAADYEIGVVYSLDNGQNWEFADGNTTEDYGALSGRPDAWDQTLETADVIKVDDVYYMYYTGYRENKSDNPHVENYEIGLATSTNGIDFVRHPASMDGPILRRDVSNINANDRHAMTSPAVQYIDGQYFMSYTGWNVANDLTGPNAGFKILGAISSDGVQWTKLPEPLIVSSEVGYSPDINESSLIYDDITQQWYVPFSTDISIGIARSDDFSGPYEIYPQAIISPNASWGGEVTAPDGIIENGTLRLWYHGVETSAYWPWVIGYSAAEHPLEW